MNGPAVLIVEDDPNLREALLDTLRHTEHPVFAAGSGPEALEILNAEDIGLVVSDLQMEPMDGHELLGEIRQQHPALPAVLMTAHGSIENAVDEMRHGAADYLVKPFEVDTLIAVIARFLRPGAVAGQTVAVDKKSVRLLRVAERVAGTDVTVTLSGESGCGKEVYARHIHAHSPRAGHPFVAINCAAIPDNMLEAVLFGYEKGAFTGASATHPGKFEQAQGGTLLLDEISEMDLGLQAKLLRVLQEKEVERIGGRALIPLDVRVLATTNRNLKAYVADGLFREDLYYRLNVFPLYIPPLRERPDDILPLAEAAIRKHIAAGDLSPELSEEAVKLLRAHTWPGNVRELENLLQRSLILMQGNVLDVGDLVFEEDVSAPPVTTVPVSASALQDDLKHREFQLIIDALREENGNRRAVAGKLGISPRTLRYKLARMRDEGLLVSSANGTNAKFTAGADAGGLQA
jgi:two-component system response regulator FlrC